MSDQQRPRPSRRPRDADEGGSNDTSDQPQDASDEQEGEEQEGEEQEEQTSSGKEVTSGDDNMQVKKDDNLRTDTTGTLQPLTEASPEDWLGSNQDPDVLLAVPNLGIDHIGIEVDNLRAHVELHAKVLDLLELHVGAQVSVETVQINIENVRVQAMLKVRLDEVTKIVGRVMDTIDKNPEILTNLTGGLGKGLEGALTQGTGGGDDGEDSGDGSGDLSNTVEGSSTVKHDETDADASEESEEEEPKNSEES